MRSRRRKCSFKTIVYIAGLIVIASLTLIPSGCSTAPPPEIILQGAGATFPNPIYQKWFAKYTADHPSVSFDYKAIGSGGGQSQILARTVDFAGSDAPLKNEDVAGAPGVILHIPTLLGAVVMTYNLPGARSPLKLSPESLSGIYLGRIARWNDPAIESGNKGANLPAEDIRVIHRSDGSGTTFAFTDYLCRIDAEWNRIVGSGTSVEWPVGVGAKGNEGVVRQVRQTANSIGYVELIYAEQNSLPYALIKNTSGQYIRPSLDSIVAAAAAIQIPDDLRMSITNAPGPTAYPIASFTYLLVYKDQIDRNRGKALVDFLWWATHDGQRSARDMNYAPLPSELVMRAEAKIRSICYQGAPLSHSENPGTAR